MFSLFKLVTQTSTNKYCGEWPSELNIWGEWPSGLRHCD